MPGRRRRMPRWPRLNAPAAAGRAAHSLAYIRDEHALVELVDDDVGLVAAGEKTLNGVCSRFALRFAPLTRGSMRTGSDRVVTSDDE